MAVEDVLIPKNRMTLDEMAVRKKQINTISAAIAKAHAADNAEERTSLHKIAKELCDKYDEYWRTSKASMKQLSLFSVIG